eukprot:CAMPEP_0117430606 /NCGR_PEP_ID=MMETSP0758-20121206/10149_1 /TAXON_ID=63605 /ORGANISM="Percolomonas cosmopolitus, Strain AE-1 (ATCC 50343)" /LENGTH=463 /DNA_ID=CAMNT_0005218801 /DNA_START=261 /DNA_END=1649 /DNA_ORIENTATION=-
MWVISQVYGHQYILENPESDGEEDDDDEEEESDEEDGEEEEEDDGEEEEEKEEEDAFQINPEDLKKQLVNFLNQDLSKEEEGEEGDDEYQPNEEEEEDEDDDVDLDEEDEEAGDMLTEDALKQLKQSLLQKQQGDFIGEEALDAAWSSVGELIPHALYFDVFKMAMSPFFQDMVFYQDPVKKMLAKIANPEPVSQRDVSFIEAEVNDEAFDARNPPLTWENQASFCKALSEAFDVTKDTDDAYYDLSRYVLSAEDDTSPLFGAPVQRLSISTMSLSPTFSTQFRFKVDPLRQCIIYHFFDFQVSAPSSKPACFEESACRAYMMNNAHGLLKSYHYSMMIPFDHLNGIQYHASVVDPTLCLLKFNLVKPPVFRRRLMAPLASWETIGDFTEDAVASSTARHTLCGKADDFLAHVAFLSSLPFYVSQRELPMDASTLSDSFKESSSASPYSIIPFKTRADIITGD